MRTRPDVLAVIALGGMAGASARYGVAQLVTTGSGGFPWATFAVNVAGSFVLGVLLVVLLEAAPASRYLRPFVASGVLGAFTTMSTYLVETSVLAKDGHVAVATTYLVSSVVAGLALAYAGVASGRQVVVRRSARRGPASSGR
jgi:CrcB protein